MVIPRIIQAPLANVSNPTFVAAACNNGALGSHGVSLLTPEEITRDIKEIKSKTTQPFNINIQLDRILIRKEGSILLSESKVKEILQPIASKLNVKETQPTLLKRKKPNVNDQINVLLKSPPPIISFCFGILDKNIIKQFHDLKTIVIGTATTLNEAKLLTQSNVDYIVLQGMEAGGHRSTFDTHYTNALIPLKELLESCLKDDQVSKIPLIAGGGITTKAQINELISLGAKSCQLGTIFIPTIESSASKEWKQAILSPQKPSDATCISCVFTGMPARVLNNETVQLLQQYNENLPPNMRFIMTDVIKHGGSKFGLNHCGMGDMAPYSSTCTPSVKEILQHLVY